MIEDDDTLQMYIDESYEHLEDIENDLLAIEEAGSDFDTDLVNKVFRAAHSIKGGAGFMGLSLFMTTSTPRSRPAMTGFNRKKYLSCHTRHLRPKSGVFPSFFCLVQFQ